LTDPRRAGRRHAPTHVAEAAPAPRGQSHQGFPARHGRHAALRLRAPCGLFR
jgi:hypothetical protein